MASGKKVFIVGPGFIGWNVLDLLVAAQYSVSALVRREEHGAAIEKSGATAVNGSLDDHDIIASHSEQSDICHVPRNECAPMLIRFRLHRNSYGNS